MEKYVNFSHSKGVQRGDTLITSHIQQLQDRFFLSPELKDKSTMHEIPYGFSAYMMVATTVVAVLISYIFSGYLLLMKSKKQVSNFDGPPGHWLKGNIDQVTFDGNGLDFHVRCAEKYKTAYKVWFGPLRSALIVCHPETVKTVLMSNAPKEKFFYSFLYPFLGLGLGLQEGSKWAQTRKLLTPAFHFNILQPYVKVFQESTAILLDKWLKGCGNVELFHDISLLTLDSILKCAFSYKSNCQIERNQEPYIKSVYEISGAILDRLIYPLYHADWLYKLTPQGRKFAHNCRNIHVLSDEVIKQRRKALRDQSLPPSKSDSQRNQHFDFLDILLQAKHDDGRVLNDEEIRAEVNTFIFAGHDTVSSALCWIIYCIALHPQHQRKCQEEVDALFASKQELKWDDLDSLRYTYLCIKEGMRMFAPVPVIARSLDKDYNIGGVDVPEDTFVMANIYAMNRSSHVWKNPEEFDPSRFQSDRCPHTFVPFSIGQRNCIGQKFAIAEIKTTLAMILHRFDLSVAEGRTVTKEELFPVLVLRSKSGIHIKLKQRFLAS